MSFYTSLTGLNAATAQLGVTSNNIANVGTTGFKRSRADFGDIFATSPLQKASSTVGQGVSLKQVTQEFNQGNISFSSNALDLAITGDGFFPMRSADGLQQVYTRNGSFLLDEQFNVVNSAGQRLMAATVDSTGSANVNERVVLNIPQKTSGEAKQTSVINLGLNFPSDAPVITEAFNRNNSATYNKSTALTVYDNGGNGYLATIYYVKTRNASQSSPFNKWQTYVYVGDDQVGASLQQATDSNGESLYVNQYGQLQPYSKVKDEITTAKTQLFSLDELTDSRSSTAATITGQTSTLSWTTGVSVGDLLKALGGSTTVPAAPAATDLLKSLFAVSVDGSGEPKVAVDLSYLASDTSQVLTGQDIASEMTKVLRRKFGDEATFDFTAPTQGSTTVPQDLQFTISTSRVPTTGTTTPKDTVITLNYATLTTGGKKPTIEDVVAEIQTQLDASANGLVTTTTSGSTTTTNKIKVSYDYTSQSLKFVDTLANSTVTVKSGSQNPNSVLGIPADPVKLGDDGIVGTKCIPNGTSIRSASLQRFGMSVTYDAVNKKFSVLSGTTGDKSSLEIDTKFTAAGAAGTTDNAKILDVFGLGSGKVETSAVAVRGIASPNATAYGTKTIVNVSGNFTVDSSNNKFVVTVDGIKATVVIPPGANYNLTSFTEALQRGINSMAASATVDGRAPDTVNGVKVTYDSENSRFVFTSGTTGADSFIKVSGSSAWGLENVDAGRGSISTWIYPTQHKDLVGGVLQPKYIDRNGQETTSGDGFTTLPPWSPVFLQKGQLTFDTGGKLVSPLQGTQLETVYLAGGKGALTINVNYAGSTQFQSAFAVLSQSQDGAPEGELVGVTIANNGLVSASFSNGTQKSLAKILLTNFSSPSGLRQIGDSSFLASAASGAPILGNAGSAGFGTLRAGATERSNVDLTSELVDLITSQRNFQANAKAIETSSTMTSAIINLRS